MNETNVTLGVLIFLCSFFIVITAVFYKIPEKVCPECPPCQPYFLDEYKPDVPVAVATSQKPKREICRYNQDVKNNFSTFYKHNCGRTPYVIYMK